MGKGRKCQSIESVELELESKSETEMVKQNLKMAQGERQRLVNPHFLRSVESGQVSKSHIGMVKQVRWPDKIGHLLKAEKDMVKRKKQLHKINHGSKSETIVIKENKLAYQSSKPSTSKPFNCSPYHGSGKAGGQLKRTGRKVIDHKEAGDNHLVMAGDCIEVFADDDTSIANDGKVGKVNLKQVWYVQRDYPYMNTELYEDLTETCYSKRKKGRWSSVDVIGKGVKEPIKKKRCIDSKTDQMNVYDELLAINAKKSYARPCSMFGSSLRQTGLKEWSTDINTMFEDFELTLVRCGLTVNQEPYDMQTENSSAEGCDKKEGETRKTFNTDSKKLEGVDDLGLNGDQEQKQETYQGPRKKVAGWKRLSGYWNRVPNVLSKVEQGINMLLFDSSQSFTCQY